MNSAWKNVKKKNTYKAYKNFVTKYPEGKDLNEAKEFSHRTLQKEVLNYFGYTEGPSIISKLNGVDLKGKCLSSNAGMDMGTKFADLYLNKMVGFYYVHGEGMYCIFHDSLEILFNDNTIGYPCNYNREAYNQNMKWIQKVHEHGHTFVGNIEEDPKASRTYFGGAININ